MTEHWWDHSASDNLFVRKMQERLARGSESDRPLVMAALRAGLAEFGAGEVRDEN